MGAMPLMRPRIPGCTQIKTFLGVVAFLLVVPGHAQVTSLACNMEKGGVMQFTVDDTRRTVRWNNSQDFTLDETRSYFHDKQGRKIPATVFYYEDKVSRGGWIELIVTKQGVKVVLGPLGNPDPQWLQWGTCRRK